MDGMSDGATMLNFIHSPVNLFDRGAKSSVHTTLSRHRFLASDFPFCLSKNLRNNFSNPSLRRASNKTSWVETVRRPA